jgi:hypothetical protein
MISLSILAVKKVLDGRGASTRCIGSALYGRRLVFSVSTGPLSKVELGFA